LTEYFLIFTGLGPRPNGLAGPRLFKEKYNNYFSGSREIPSNDFLTWLLGFTEGDGSFVVCNRNDLQFVSTQGGLRPVMMYKFFI